MNRLAVAILGLALASCAAEARVSREEAAGAVIVHSAAISAYPTVAPAPFDSPASYRQYQLDSGIFVNDDNEHLVRSVREAH